LSADALKLSIEKGIGKPFFGVLVGVAIKRLCHLGCHFERSDANIASGFDRGFEGLVILRFQILWAFKVEVAFCGKQRS
jgi:hypothetical protein